jgi:hypothetical protein
MRLSRAHGRGTVPVQHAQTLTATPAYGVATLGGAGAPLFKLGKDNRRKSLLFVYEACPC